MLISEINNSQPATDDQPMAMERIVAISEQLEEEEVDDEEEDEVEPRKVKHRSRDSNIASRKKWSSEEKEEIKKYFKKYFNDKVRPPPAFCEKVVRKSKILASRKKDVLKKKVFRMIDKLKK